MAVVVQGMVEDFGATLKLQCGTAYALTDEQTGLVLYALLGADSKLFGRVGEKVKVLGEESDAYPGAEYELLEVEQIRDNYRS